MTRPDRATTSQRLARYAALAPAIATPAFAAIHGASGLNHEIGFGGTAGAGGVLFQIGGENVTFNTRTSGSKRRVEAFVSNADFRVLELRSRAFYNNGAATVSLRGTWGGGLPVSAGATFNNPGRNTASFAGNNGRSFKTLNRGTLNFSNTRADWALRFNSAFVKDPQGLGDTGQTWYLLFKFWGGANANTEEEHHQHADLAPTITEPSRRQRGDAEEHESEARKRQQLTVGKLEHHRQVEHRRRIQDGDHVGQAVTQVGDHHRQSVAGGGVGLREGAGGARHGLA